MIETKSEVESPTTDATVPQTHPNDKHAFQYVVAISGKYNVCYLKVYHHHLNKLVFSVVSSYGF